MALPQTDEEVRLWLANLELTGCLDAFLAADWRGEKLLELNREELADLGVPKAQRNLVMLAVEALRQGDAPLTLADAKAPTYAPALTEQATAACRELGLHPPAPWVDAVSQQWPGPIAHEYQRLRDVLAQGQIVAAIFQLRDLAEVLVKFPALVMARDLIEHGDAAAAREARKSLFGGLLSMGHWVGRIAGGTLAAEMARVRKDHDLLLPELADWFGAGGRGNKSGWVETLAKLVTWRNDTLGHGVFRLNPQEYLPELIEAVGAINRQLAAQVAQGLWAEVRLCGAEAVTLTGWQAISHWHDGPAGAAHLEQEAPLWLEKGGRTLQLAPLAMLRRCTVCARQDVFLYDSLGGHSLRDGFTLLDYLSGHRLSLPIHRATTLHAEAQAVVESPDAPVVANDTAKPDEDYGNSIVNEMLEAKLLAARYLRPDYLREPLRAFVDTNERGVFWLTAPSHTGKSVFTHGLAFPAEMGDKPLWPTPATAVVVLHIRREFKTWPAQLREFMRTTVLKETFKREAGRLALPELDVKAADPAAAFATLLQASFQLKPAFIERLVLILDGLDELPASPEGESGIADFIPQPDALPPGCFLLLTSRPLPDCPPHIRRALADRFSGCAAFGAYALDFAQTGSTAYFQLLRAYFDRELADRLRQEAYQALVDFVAGRAEVVCRNDLSRVQPPALAALLKEEWNQLTAAVRVRSPQDAPGLLETVVQPVLARYDAAFAEVCQKATDRFLYVAHLIDLLRDGQLALTEVGALPVGAGLYAHYLRQLERAVVGRDAAQTGNRGEDNKLWAFVQRVILTLAAAEQAHVAFQQMLPVSVRDEVFRGVPLGILAALLDEPGRTLRLTFTLYSLKTILAVWKGEDSQDAHYALGLKDFTGAVASLWPEDLQQAHRLLANQTLEALEGRWETVTDEEPLDQWRLLYLLAHAESLEEEPYRKQVVENEAIQSTFWRLGEALHFRSRYAVATQYWSLQLVITQKQVTNQDSLETTSNLAIAYQGRGVTRCDSKDLWGALEDCGCAIMLWESLHQRLGAEWPPAWANNLAGVYMNRGNAYRDDSDLSRAMADYGRAIELMEALRRRLRIEWPPAWANDLALTYMNRGNARRVGNDLSGALADYGQAIVLMEALRRRLGSDWPPDWINDLAGVYMNRGNAYGTGNDLREALANYGQAIELREALRQRLGSDWSPAWAYDLAVTYMNRGVTRVDNKDLRGALVDYEQTIELMGELRERLGAEWPLAWADVLAMAYMNRGNAHGTGKDLQGALADYGQAIELREALRLQLGSEWPLAWANSLATTYMNRGITLKNQGDLQAAVTDWRQAAEICSQLADRHPLYTGEQLLKAISWQFGGFLNLEQWPYVAQCFMQFLKAHHHLEATWKAEKDNAESPWHVEVWQFKKTVHSLDNVQRAALLEALGDQAEWIKGLLGWNDAKKN